jgi:hypothetical protein
MAKKYYYFSNHVEEDSRLGNLFFELQEEFPKLVICAKDSVWYHYVLHILVCIVTFGFNRKYLKGFTTTFTNHIGLSENHFKRLVQGNTYDQDKLWVTLSHERVHLRQFRDYGFFKMVLMYLFPPFLLAYGRYKIELPAYLETLKCHYELDKEYVKSEEYKEWWIKQFTGPNYGWMMVLRSKVENQFDIELIRLVELSRVERLKKN